MTNKYLKQEWFLKTEVLPLEIPNLFSNAPISDSIDEILDTCIDELTNSDKSFEIPLKFSIKKNNGSLRDISVMHPRSQLRILIYVMRYEFLLINFLKKSNFNARKIIKLNKVTFNEEKYLKQKKEKLEQDFGLSTISNIPNEELENSFKRYFSYELGAKLFDILHSPGFQRSIHSFKYFLKLDIQGFFDSIYTHSLTWAIVGDKNIGKKYKNQKLSKTFASQTDIVQQKSNNNETNGIITGPEINRIISDIILSQSDFVVEKKLKNEKLVNGKDYKIYRFIDDYYIFSFEKETLEKIEREIVAAISEYNLKLNLSKKEVQEQPFKIASMSINNLQKILRLIDIEKKLILNKLIEKDDSKIKEYRTIVVQKYGTKRQYAYEVNKSQILVKKTLWTELHDSIQLAINQEKNSKRKVVLYLLKSISIEIYAPMFIRVTSSIRSGIFSYLQMLYSALENITNIYSINPDSDTTSAYIRVLIRMNNSISKLKIHVQENENNFIDRSLEYIENIENKIFENVYRILNFNSENISNITDLLVFIKSFDRKLSSKFLCELIEKNKNDYFSLCAIAYYMKDNSKRYKVSLDYLYKTIVHFVEDYPCTESSRLVDGKYFYILNDFIYYKPFNEEQIDKLQTIMKNELLMLGEGSREYKIYGYLTKRSYYNWELTNIDFERLIIHKLTIFNSNPIDEDY